MVFVFIYLCILLLELYYYYYYYLQVSHCFLLHMAVGISVKSKQNSMAADA